MVENWSFDGTGGGRAGNPNSRLLALGHFSLVKQGLLGSLLSAIGAFLKLEKSGMAPLLCSLVRPLPSQALMLADRRWLDIRFDIHTKSGR